jgi:hypothetical protein
VGANEPHGKTVGLSARKSESLQQPEEIISAHRIRTEETELGLSKPAVAFQGIEDTIEQRIEQFNVVSVT